MWSRVTRLHSSVFLRQAGNTGMTLAGKMMMIPWWYQVLIDSFNYLPRFSSYQKEPQTTLTTFYWAAMDHHQRNILTVWENINCYQRSLIMDVLCIRAWLEMTDISSILVTTSFIIITTLSKYFTPGYHWYITRNISNTAVREMRSVRKGQVLVPQLGWQYRKIFPDCKTVR